MSRPIVPPDPERQIDALEQWLASADRDRLPPGLDPELARTAEGLRRDAEAGEPDPAFAEALADRLRDLPSAPAESGEASAEPTPAKAIRSLDILRWLALAALLIAASAWLAARLLGPGSEPATAPPIDPQAPGAAGPQGNPATAQPGPTRSKPTPHFSPSPPLRATGSSASLRGGTPPAAPRSRPGAIAPVPGPAPSATATAASPVSPPEGSERPSDTPQPHPRLTARASDTPAPSPGATASATAKSTAPPATHTPGEITATPREVTATPRDATATPRDATATPREVTATPREATRTPREPTRVVSPEPTRGPEPSETPIAAGGPGSRS